MLSLVTIDDNVVHVEGRKKLASRDHPGLCHKLECGYAPGDPSGTITNGIPCPRRTKRLSKVCRQGAVDKHLTIKRVKHVRFVDRAARSGGSRFNISQYCRREGRQSMFVMVRTDSHSHVFFFGALNRSRSPLSFMTRSSEELRRSCLTETASDATQHLATDNEPLKTLSSRELWQGLQ